MRDTKNKINDPRWIERFSLQSSAVKDEYLIEVSLPETYHDSSKPLSVLYVLDADMSFGITGDIVKWLAFTREIPEVIVVGISYGSSTQEWWDKRSRDYAPWNDRGKVWGDWPLAGGAGNYRQFLKDELFPVIEEEYRITPHRTIVGLSLAGLFAVYVLFTQPELFNGYVISGTPLIWDQEHILNVEKVYNNSHKKLNAKVFTAVGSLEETVILEPWDRFNDLIRGRAYEGLQWKTHRFEGETHISVWPSVITRGLKYIFNDKSQ